MGGATLSINVIVTRNGVRLSSGTQYNYTRGELYRIDDLDHQDPIRFIRTPLSKQSSQYAYTNENPISVIAQRVDGITDAQFRYGTDVVMLMSGARNSVETKVFLGPRTSSYSSMILYDDTSSVQAEFLGEEFERLLNGDLSKFISIVYTRVSKSDSFELDLHTDSTTYNDAKDYTSLDYLGIPNYPHFNQIKYSNRLVSEDDFITSSMGINSTIKYTPHFGNYYIRPDFVKAFKGFKLISKVGANLTIRSDKDEVKLDKTNISFIEFYASKTDLYYDKLYWDYHPKIPGINLVVDNTNLRSTLFIDPKILHNNDLFTSDITVTLSSSQGLNANKIIHVYEDVDHRDSEITDEVTIYVAYPDKDKNPWYDLTDYLNIEDAFRMRSDLYTMTTESQFIELDRSNYRFKMKGIIDEYMDDGTIEWIYHPSGSSKEFKTIVSIIKSLDPISRDSEESGTILSCKFKVLDWVQCDDSTINIISKSDHTCVISSNVGVVSIKAVTLHGVYLYKEVLE